MFRCGLGLGVDRPSQPMAVVLIVSLKPVHRYIGQLIFPVIIYQFCVFILGVAFAAGVAAYDNMGTGAPDNKFSPA